MNRIFVNEEGQAAVEYSVLAVSVAAVIVLVVTAFGLQVQNLFQQVVDVF